MYGIVLRGIHGLLFILKKKSPELDNENMPYISRTSEY